MGKNGKILYDDPNSKWITDPKNPDGYNVVIFGDGYAENDNTNYYSKDVQKMIELIKIDTPFKELFRALNFYQMVVKSNESGVTTNNYANGQKKSIERKTYFDCVIHHNEDPSITDEIEDESFKNTCDIVDEEAKNVEQKLGIKFDLAIVIAHDTNEKTRDYSKYINILDYKGEGLTRRPSAVNPRSVIEINSDAFYLADFMNNRFTDREKNGRTITHELGHAVGNLPHCQDPECKMNVNSSDSSFCEKCEGAVYDNLVSHLPKSIIFAIQKNTYSLTEAKNGFVTTDDAFWVVVNGFSAEGLGLKSISKDDSKIPEILDFNLGETIAKDDKWSDWPNGVSVKGISRTFKDISADDTSDVKLVQPIIFKYSLTVQESAFNGISLGAMRILKMKACMKDNKDIQSSIAPIILIVDPNPYISSGSNPCFSIDLRAFTMKKPEKDDPQYKRFGVSYGTDGKIIIQQILKNLRTHPDIYVKEFNDLPQKEEESILDLSYSKENPIHNFALARVHYQGVSQTAYKVRVFFRMFSTMSASCEFDENRTYRTFPKPLSDPNPDPNDPGKKIPDKIPLLGIETQFAIVQQSGKAKREVLTVPFFAEKRIKPINGVKLAEQIDETNVQDITATDEVTYYGCYLDINTNDPIIPYMVGDSRDTWNGPFAENELVTIQNWINGGHQCLIAEISYDPFKIPEGSSPGLSDKLAQRNLAYGGSPNPGIADSRRVSHTFEVQPDNQRTRTSSSEMLFDWGNTPVGSKATIYLPAVSADAIITLASDRYIMHRLTKIDDHTISCPTGGATFIPLPSNENGQNTTERYAGLLTIDLSENVKKGDIYNIIIKQLTHLSPNIVGGETLSFKLVRGMIQIAVSVKSKEELLDPEEHLLSIMRWIQKSKIPESRWFPVFNRYVDQIAEKVDALGGDSSKVLPSPSGNWPGDASDPSGCCRLWETINAIVLATLITTLGTLSGVAVLALAVLLIVTAYLWWTQCQPVLCSLIRVLLVGAGIGALILILLMLLGVSSPQLLTVLVAAIILAAIAGVAGFIRHCS